jgi:tRNA 2-thiocytidine biosynthesis protein TtcA
MERYQEIERSIIKKYRKPIWKKFIDAVNEYKLINEGDRIAVCISGGKDSMLMAKLMQEIQRHGIMKFELEFIVMDPGYSDVHKQTIFQNAKILNIPITVFESPIFQIVEDMEDSPCYLCARMRRGYLYKKAQALGCNKIALGHHFDDVIETILMGMFYGGQFQTMMPKLHSTNHPGMQLIRPLYLVKEGDIIAWAQYHDLHFIRCACSVAEKNAMGGQGVYGSKRQEIKELIAQLRKTNPGIDLNIYRSSHNVNLNTIIGYHGNDMTYHFLDDYDTRGEKGC